MSSQESSGSSGTSKLSLSLSQDTIDYMFNSVNNMPGVSDIAVVADITSNRYIAGAGGTKYRKQRKNFFLIFSS